MRDYRAEEQRQIRIRAIIAVVPTVFIVAAILFGLIRSAFLPDENPLDNGIDKKRRIVEEAHVTDKRHNGFRLIYVTQADVTPERCMEIRRRPHILDSIRRLKVEAPRYFGDMLMTDIYTFTDFASRFHPDPDLVLHNIFVAGREKMNLYVGPSPMIENPAEWISSETLQGAMYISSEDFSRYTSRGKKVYRYWQCRMPYKHSDTDEHFSHFSEDERLY